MLEAIKGKLPHPLEPHKVSAFSLKIVSRLLDKNPETRPDATGLL